MMVRFHFNQESVSCSEFLQDHLEILNSGCDGISIGLSKFKELCGKVDRIILLNYCQYMFDIYTVDLVINIL